MTFASFESSGYGLDSHCSLVTVLSCIKERLRAATLGYTDPICRSFEATTAMYNSVLEETFKEIKRRPKGKVVVMVASHNEDTVRHTLHK